MALSNGSLQRNADMTLGRSTSGAIKVKTDGGTRAVQCSCCGAGCDYDAWQISVSQSLVGYAGFVCDASQPSDLRYLQYNISCDAGFTGNWCGGGAQPTSVNITTQIDPFTGLTCTQGLPPNGYTCAGGTNCEETCTETNRTYTCEARQEDCAGEGMETIQTIYSLSAQNTMAAVIARATSLINSFGFSALPGPNTSGEVKVGSGGQAVLAWQAFSGEPSASRWTSRGVAQLTKSVVKLKRDLRYKIVSYVNGVESEEVFDGVKDALIYLNPPSSDGSMYFRSGQVCSLTAVTAEVESTNQLSTKTLRTAPPPGDGDEPEDQPCTSFFIAPDCKSYTTRTTVENRSRSGSGSEQMPEDERYFNSSFSGKYSSTTIETACAEPQISETSSSKGSYSDTSYGYTTTFSTDCSDGQATDTYEGDTSPSYEFPSCGMGSMNWCSIESNCQIICGEGSYEFEGKDRYDRDATISAQCKSGPYGSSFSSTQQSSANSPGFTASGSASCNGSTTVSYSGEVSNAFDEGDEETPANFETNSWTQQGGLCAWKTLATNGTMNESTADITINVSVDADPEKDYNVEVQMVIESNTTLNNCSSRSYDSYVQTFTIKGGEVRQAGQSLSAASGETKCLVHHGVVAYEKP
jgi:hypothetical protein